MKTKDPIALLSKQIAENPTARHELARALASGDPDEIDRVVTALGGGKLGAPKQTLLERAERFASGPMYLT